MGVNSSQEEIIRDRLDGSGFCLLLPRIGGIPEGLDWTFKDIAAAWNTMSIIPREVSLQEILTTHMINWMNQVQEEYGGEVDLLLPGFL